MRPVDRGKAQHGHKVTVSCTGPVGHTFAVGLELQRQTGLDNRHRLSCCPRLSLKQTDVMRKVSDHSPSLKAACMTGDHCARIYDLDLKRGCPNQQRSATELERHAVG